MRPAIEVVRSRRGLRLTARALGGFARLRAGGGGARRDAACGCGVRRGVGCA